MICDVSETNLKSEKVRNNPNADIYREHLIPVNQISVEIEKDYSVENIRKELMKAEVAIVTKEERKSYEGKDAPKKGIYGVKSRKPKQIEMFKQDFKLK
jgi:hypothetical protein